MHSLSLIIMAIAPLAALLILMAIVALAAAIAIWWLLASAQKRKAALGTLPNGATPGSQTISEAWTTAPPAITVGTNATFVLTVNSSGVSNVFPVAGRLYAFGVQPVANLSIVSVTPANPGGPNFGSTAGGGTITVVVVANSPPPGEQPVGVLVARQVNAAPSAGGIAASFTVQ
jgi:hypothetical protein